MPKDTYIDEIVIREKKTENWIATIRTGVNCITIETVVGDNDWDTEVINTKLGEKITLGNVCQYLKGKTIIDKIWTENYLGTQLNEWGYDWEITYKE